MGASVLAKKRTDKDNIRDIIKYRETNDIEILNQMLESNVNLCHHIARKFDNTKIDYDEKFSSAQFGMLKAIKTFNLNKDVKFVTYASRCMSNEILMSIRNESKHNKLGCISLEQPINIDIDGNELTIIDILSDGSKDFKAIEDKDIAKKVINHLENTLNDRDLVLFRNMISHTPVNQRTMARKLNITQSYISRIYKKITKEAREFALRIEH